jgi:predicted nucleic acid-binding protein
MNGITDLLHRARIYVDANPFIYAVEGGDALASSINVLFAGLRARPGFAVTSELTLAEVLPRASRLPDAIHVVTAIRNDCKSFVSGDARIRLPVDIRLISAEGNGIARLAEELS